MCLITEHAKAKQKIKELEAKIAELEPIPVTPVTDLVMITRNDYATKMRLAGIELISLATPLDSELSITSKAELDRIAPDLVYPADYYIAQIWDCEDYGLQAQSDAGRKFKVSGVRLALGSMPLGYHGFVLALDKEFNIWWLEPNAGFPYAGVWYEIGEKGYEPDKVFV